MLDIDLELTIGALLHDIGKVVYRGGEDNRLHSISGHDYLKELGTIDNSSDILDCVKYHHAKALRNANIEDDSIAYIVYLADNIASASDRRKKDEDETGFELHTALQPVFNLLNGNNGNCYYSSFRNNMEKDINFPIDDKLSFSKEQYNEIISNISDNLKGVEISNEYVNSLLEVLEANLSFIPSSTSRQEVPDVSLYDHLKMTAAIACCIRKNLESKSATYRELLFEKEDEFYSQKAFLIASLDISGIQKFIYTIQSKNALRTLRARSFYLEVMMEHLIDELLDKQQLSRANLLYSGGGHCYMILPNTENARKIFDCFIKDTNRWLLDYFQTDLYVAGGYSECSANDLKNNPLGSYEEIFRRLSFQISERKMHRYTADEIMQLNKSSNEDYSRECGTCKRISDVDENGICPVCAAMEKMSGRILKSGFFSVISEKNENMLPLPFDCSVVADEEETLKNRMKTDEVFVRAYSKNRSYTGKSVATKLWVGDYTTGDSFQEFAQKAKGVKRIGILRADVDNLGSAFVSGLKSESNNDRYVTISRTSTLSRQLSLFFKLHINKILEHPEYTLDRKQKEKRHISIVYSGGDDIFAVGAWDDIIEFSIDLRRAFSRYTENTLSISAGIGLYDDGYPISASARETELMVDKSKKLTGKNAITLLEDGCIHDDSETNSEISDGTYRWDEFEQEVIGEKFNIVSEYMEAVQNVHGNALLYRILELIRSRDDRINFARFVYLIARLEPEASKDTELMDKFNDFSSMMAKWYQNEKDCRQLKTAIELYVYLNRERVDEE